MNYARDFLYHVWINCKKTSINMLLPVNYKNLACFFKSNCLMVIGHYLLKLLVCNINALVVVLCKFENL